jgi:hypothetical protein
VDEYGVAHAALAGVEPVAQVILSTVYLTRIARLQGEQRDGVQIVVAINPDNLGGGGDIAARLFEEQHIARLTLPSRRAVDSEAALDGLATVKNFGE